MSSLKRFHEDKELQKDWADFIMAELDKEALDRVYRGKDTAALKEARNIIAKSFKTLNELFTLKPKPRKSPRAV